MTETLIQIRISNLNSRDLFACNWLRAPATTQTHRLLPRRPRNWFADDHVAHWGRDLVALRPRARRLQYKTLAMRSNPRNNLPGSPILWHGRTILVSRWAWNSKCRLWAVYDEPFTPTTEEVELLDDLEPAGNSKSGQGQVATAPHALARSPAPRRTDAPRYGMRGGDPTRYAADARGGGVSNAPRGYR